jgi:DNA-binding transcriptional LysR family regulator
LEAWCAGDQVAPLKIIELGSYHAILGCCIAGMGVALVPAAVLDTYSERFRLSEHPVQAPWGRVNTMLIWRKDSAQAKVEALAQLLST